MVVSSDNVFLLNLDSVRAYMISFRVLVRFILIKSISTIRKKMYGDDLLVRKAQDGLSNLRLQGFVFFLFHSELWG
jgi:hypothetical protein